MYHLYDKLWRVVNCYTCLDGKLGAHGETVSMVSMVSMVLLEQWTSAWAVAA